MAELFRQGERDHVIGGAEAFVELAINPFGGGVATALGTGFFVTTMEGVVCVPAVLATVAISTESCGAAGEDAVNGTSLRMGE